MANCKKTNTEQEVLPVDPNAINVKVGDTQTITLPVTNSIGSTGVSWFLATNTDDKVITSTKDTVIASGGSGVWGYQIFTLKALKTGTANLQFKYGRSYDTTSVFDRKYYNYVVK